LYLFRALFATFAVLSNSVALSVPFEKLISSLLTGHAPA